LAVDDDNAASVRDGRRAAAVSGRQVREDLPIKDL